MRSCTADLGAGRGKSADHSLALSLHATTDEKRRKLMPIANKYSIDELMEACAYYHQKTGRRVTFEYSMVKGVNDSAEDAQQLTPYWQNV